MQPLPIATGFYVDASKPIASQECVNFKVQIPETNALSDAQLIGMAGITLRSTAGTKSARGAHVMNGIPYTVNGTALYRENDDGTTTSLGTISGSGRVSMADNGTQICIVVPGSTGYIYTVAGGLATISDAEFTTNIGPSQQVVFKDGYFIHYNNASASGTGVVFFISNLNNGLAYDALDFGSAEEDPDKITGIHVSRGTLYIGGEVTREMQDNIGVVSGNFPFQKVKSGTDTKGVKAQFSLIDFENGFAFVGGGLNEQPAVWIGSGNVSRKISTSAIDNEISKLTDAQAENIFCTTYAEDGGYFLNVHLPDKCFTYDSLASSLAQRKVWTERRSKDSFGRDTTWRVNNIIDAYGKTIVTDNQSGSIGELDSDAYTEYGVDITASASTAPFSNGGNPVEFPAMELTCESGVGNIVAPGDDPVVTREISENGGKTFGNGTSRKLGKQGEYKKRQIWRREGQASRFWVYRFSMAGPFKKVIIKLEVGEP
jgi:hypothetical protein